MIRRRYAWHLRPPFKAQFDYSHWWEGQSEIEPAAALYELARRHPLVHELWLRNFAAATRNRRGVAIWVPSIRESWVKKIARPISGDIALPPSLYWTCLLGMESWVKLDRTDQQNWKFNAGNLKGLDFRDPDLQCQCIKVLAHWKITDQRRAALRNAAKTDMELRRLVQANLSEHPPTDREWEAAIAQRAIEAHRQGCVLLAVVPDLKSDKAASVMAEKYREHLALYPAANSQQRARWQDWLHIISNFEKAAADRKLKKSQAFVHYRRAMDGIRFT